LATEIFELRETQGSLLLHRIDIISNLTCTGGEPASQHAVARDRPGRLGVGRAGWGRRPQAVRLSKLSGVVAIAAGDWQTLVL